MISTWKLKGRGEYEGAKVISSRYFIANGCASCGWGEPVLKYPEEVINFETYKTKWIEMMDRKWGYQGVHHLFESLKKSDFLWTRLDGEYYVTQLPDNPRNLFYIDTSEEAIRYDSVVQIKGLTWIKCGTEETVPGSISSFTSNRNSIVRVDSNETIQENYTATSFFSNLVFNGEKNIAINDKMMIFNFIGPSSFEDLVALWLYDSFKYVVIPSSNKIGTQTYEFVLVDGTKSRGAYLSKKRIYLQAKNGSNTLSCDDYIHILDEGDEVWLVSSRGSIQGIKTHFDKGEFLKIERVDNSFIETTYRIEVLIEFMFDKSNRNILPFNIALMLDYFVQ